jgi:hypothetical protein
MHDLGELVAGGCAPLANVSFLDYLTVVSKARVVDACLAGADVRAALRGPGGGGGRRYRAPRPGATQLASAALSGSSHDFPFFPLFLVGIGVDVLVTLLDPSQRRLGRNAAPT